MKKLHVTKVLLLITMIFFLQSCERMINRLKDNEEITTAQQDCIVKVIAKDDSIGKVRNRQSKSISLSQSITNYTEGMKKISTEGCPKDFARDFNSHIKAWNDLLIVTDKYPELRGDMHDLLLQLEKSKDSTELKKLKGGIWQTWELLEKRPN
ncbi:hypothetical protein [Flavobacterium sp.]|uniref:hypothetical protein n=1 Tax=Flavobacterium sp. TaxID=239 RepID=UPI0026178B78|nr:hypothetical protein [Flavobacterium sp.]